MPDNLDAQVLSMERCRELFGIVEQAAKSLGAEGVEALFGGHRDALTRFANNTIHQSVAEQAQWLSVRVVLDHKTARATTNRFDADSIRRAVEQSVALARSVAPDPELLPLAPPCAVPSIPRASIWTPPMPPRRSRACRRGRHTAGGRCRTDGGGNLFHRSDRRGHSEFRRPGRMAPRDAGAVLHHRDGGGQFRMGQGFRGGAPVLPACVELARRASDKARLSRAPREIPPGRYTVVLEPAAVLDFVGQMFGDFSATSMRDQRSFLTDRLGTEAIRRKHSYIR